MNIQNIADLLDPDDPQGRTYREINNAQDHYFEVGKMVEVVDTGVRLFVAHLSRDCDGTPLYTLTPELREDDLPLNEMKWIGGYSKESLRLILDKKSKEEPERDIHELEKQIKQLRRSICIYMREEYTDVDFGKYGNPDQAAISLFLSDNNDE